MCYDLEHQIRCAKLTFSGRNEITPMVCCSFGCIAHHSFYSMILATFSDIQDTHFILHYNNDTQGFVRGVPLMGSLIFFSSSHT